MCRFGGVILVPQARRGCNCDSRDHTAEAESQVGGNPHTKGEFAYARAAGGVVESSPAGDGGAA